MKKIYFLFFIIIVSCSSSKHKYNCKNKFEIIKVDTIRDYFVLQAKNKKNNEIIVLAEKDKMKDCKLLKNNIISDCISEEVAIKSGSKMTLIGLNISVIDGVKVREKGKLVKVISDCSCIYSENDNVPN